MTSAGRVWSGVTAAVVAIGVVMQALVTATSTGGDGFYKENPERVLNVFAYFTIQSNLLLGGTCLLLALQLGKQDSTLFKTLRLNGVLCIAVTGIVYHLVLAGTDDPSGWAWVANLLVHTATPLLGVLGWLVFGPRRQTDGRIVAWSVVYPLLWVAFTLIRGEGTGFYPYEFADVDLHGYGRVLLNCLFVALLFLALAAGATLLDRRIGRRTVKN
ncbi:Pr6Pr family membrane protein [Streptomyces sp. SID13031]|uniref:Pr6Pr family membrane protein n=1 Tax=Streptomyces sp. SID13031 TaxID=2706046 RepID=UPI0013CA1531|nr:Pr6Pr family membrane protein [Streptomyces sp. SID13031]NEA34414.1 F420-dependent oxidoreductase [Streptomyces sp. SID13031]